ncbi:heterocyst development glycosyltransferase HepC [Okeanomitos corallinicola TIOX110]|uniref:Heterocyst development glycosyltransferase HepC n=1 Tax=Okeanomitos corallinicola TIOX110 TaxID=3133117 RepID=A0ABZ2UWA4_9CYAN
MTISIVPNLQEHNTISQQPQNFHPQNFTLYWRRGQLLVKSSKNAQIPYLPLENKQLLIECLQHSPINLVTIDPKLGDAALKFWLDACQKANKPIYISPSARNNRPKSSNKFFKFIQPVIHPILALILLILVSPLMLILTLMILSNGSISLFSYQWQIGERGKIFPMINFCTTGKHNQSTLLGLWMSKYHLNHLPRLFNILRGEMKLIGSNNLCLEDVIKFSSTTESIPVNGINQVIKSWHIKAKLS